MTDVTRLSQAVAAGMSVLCMGAGVIVACFLVTNAALLVMWQAPLSELERWFVPLGSLVGGAAVAGACASHNRPDVRDELWRILGRLVGTGVLWLGLGTVAALLFVRAWQALS